MQRLETEDGQQLLRLQASLFSIGRSKLNLADSWLQRLSDVLDLRSKPLSPIPIHSTTCCLLKSKQLLGCTQKLMMLGNVAQPGLCIVIHCVSLVPVSACRLQQDVGQLLISARLLVLLCCCGDHLQHNVLSACS